MNKISSIILQPLNRSDHVYKSLYDWLLPNIVDGYAVCSVTVCPCLRAVLVYLLYHDGDIYDNKN
jgi:hypothetical protein